MNARPVTDAQISRALRARLPEQAAAGLRERILAAAETTTQQRELPSFLGALSEADPVARRRSLLIAAALLVALAFASAAAVGALRMLQRDPLDELSLDPPADLPAFVLSSHERLPQLPPVALSWRDSDSKKGRVYVDRTGAVRFDRFVSSDATEPSSSTILRADHRISGVAPVNGVSVWVEPTTDEHFEDDPRVFLGGIFSVGPEPGCETARDQGDVGNVATGWRYVGVEIVAGRPTHRIACVGELGFDIDLWIDIGTRLSLRTRESSTDDAGQPIPGQFTTTEVTEIAFGEQPAALFEPPEGVTRMSEDAYGAYLCGRDLPDEERVGFPGVRESCSTPEAEATPQPEPSPTPTPTPTVRPDANACTVPRGGPSEPIGPLTWTPASLKGDWPAPVRPEPAGGGSVQPMPLTYLDPTGDAGSDVLPCVDIRAVVADTSKVGLKLVSNQRPRVDPAEQWIAYGLVVDDDRDGVPDWRYGTDLSPAQGKGDQAKLHSRWWRTNLHTGQTEAGVLVDDGDWLAAPFKIDLRDGDVSFRLSGELDTTRGPTPWGFELDVPFYTWASVIVNGHAVATDYAPDAGWLVATPGAKPGGTYELEGGEGGFKLPLSMTLPDGWLVGRDISCCFSDDTVVRDAHRSGDVFLLRTGVQLVILDDPSDPCSKPYGPGVDDVVRYLEDQPKKLKTPGDTVAGPRWAKVSIDISTKSDVVLDGYRGTYLEYEVDLRSRVAPDEEPCGWPGWEDHHSQTWILDVDGVRIVIDAISPLGSSEAVRAELRQAVGSIHFER